jgi:hypothetical protein
MDELIELLKTKAGLTDEQAKKSMEVMKEFISSKVPPMFSGYVDNFFTSSKD